MKGHKLPYWFKERGREVILWPVNLVRDFPARLHHLGSTLWAGGAGLAAFLPEGVRAVKSGRGRGWLRRSARRFLGWLHRLFVQLFDLGGGPELAQFFMHLFTHTTPLTDSERELLQAVLGENALRWGDVRVAEGGLYDWVFRHNGHLAFTTWYTVNFPRHGRHTRQNLPILVHELTHVFQYHHVGTRYMTEAIYMLVTTRRDCYRYGGASGLCQAAAAGRSFAQFNREQQAQIVQDYYSCQMTNQDTSPFQLFLEQLRRGEL